MSRRRILNITSVKKQDNMLATKTDSGGGSSKGPLVTNQAVVMCFMPTARKTGIDPSNPAVRTQQATYGVGYKENVTIDVLTGSVWRWRRIVFSLKGSSLRDYIDPPGDTGVATYTFFDQVPEGGCNRLLRPMDLAGQTKLFDYLYRGTQNSDWSGLFLGKVDTSRVSVISDKMRYIRPMTQLGTSRSYKMWCPIGHNIIYDDDKESNKIGDSAFSTSSKRGWGDLYVVDIIAPGAATGEYSLQFDVEGTYYFHERS